MDTVHELDICRKRRKTPESKCTEAEKHLFLSLTGKPNNLGHGALPQAAYVASSLQQCMGALKITNLIAANGATREIKSLVPVVAYHPIGSCDVDQASVLAFSEASHGKTSYGQTGYIPGIHIPSPSKAVYHVLDWHSSKVSRVAFSSVGSEIIAAAECADRAGWLTSSLQELYQESRPLPLVFTVDSKGLPKYSVLDHHYTTRV